MSPALTLAVFAKSPAPGQVKTRLCPPLTAAQAARLHAASVHDTVRKAQAVAPVTVYYAGDPAPLQALLADLPPLTWQAQSGGDLGARLARVPAPCLILGTDSPHLPTGHVREALGALRTRDVVLGPADDGGYTLIALRAPQPSLFDGVAWSTSDVLAQTLDRAATAGLTVHRLPSFYDLDTGADLDRLRADLAAGVVADCPATRAALAGLAQSVPGHKPRR